MSEKRVDAKNRWRNVMVSFRMSPEEAKELNVKVARKMEMYLEALLEELQFYDEKKMSQMDLDEILIPLKHILTILNESD